jgi:plasmid replication initiation protein
MKDDNVIVVQVNDLIEGTCKVSIDEFRLLNLALSKVEKLNPQPALSYTITIEDFQLAFGVSPNNGHVKLKSAAQGLMRKPIVTYQQDPDTGLTKGIERPWFSMIEYDVIDSIAAIKVSFSEFVRPFLFDLKKNFTGAMFKNIAMLDTPFAVRLYYWLSQSKSIKNKKQGPATTTLDIDWMKKKAGIDGKYTDYRTFRRKMIEPSISKINSKTDLSVTYRPIKKGANICSLEFSYVEERSVTTKPIRERLPRQPHIKQGSDAQEVWARESINIMSDYDLALIESGYRLEIGDLIKLQGWYNVVRDETTADEIGKEVEERRRVNSTEF